jgi:cytochrome c biogenesis protein
VRKVDLKDAIESRLGAGHKTVSRKELRNVGPSINYKLRDASGQAREFHNYMEPIDLGEGVPVFLMGLRETPAEEFRYLRLPADESGRLDSFLRLREALADPAVREQAVRRYAVRATDPARPEVAQQLAASAGRALALFAGVGTAAGPNGKPVAGLQALSDFMEANVPEADRARAGEVVVRIVNGALLEVAQIARARAGLKPLDMSDATRAFMNQAVLALSDLTLYPAPMAFQLKDFTQVQASVFQVARAPGRNIVYLGCALLIVGIFAMLYVRERRLWDWLTPQDADGSRATLALSSNRKTMDTDREFAHLRTQLLDPTPP